MERGRVIKQFTNKRLGTLYFGNLLEPNQLRYLTQKEKDENMIISDVDRTELPIDYGLIFQSKMYPFPKSHPEETYNEKMISMLNEQECTCFGDLNEDIDLRCILNERVNKPNTEGEKREYDPPQFFYTPRE